MLGGTATSWGADSFGWLAAGSTSAGSPHLGRIPTPIGRWENKATLSRGLPFLPKGFVEVHCLRLEQKPFVFLPSKQNGEWPNGCRKVH